MDHVVAIDASCSCGEELKGAWSLEEVDTWVNNHMSQLLLVQELARLQLALEEEGHG